MSTQPRTDVGADLPLGDRPLGVLLAQLADRTPAPGGGAVAGVLLALAAGTGGMVLRYSIGRASLSAHAPALEAHALAVDGLRALALQLADEDAEAYARLTRLRKQPSPDPVALARAELDAAGVPLATLAASADLLRHLVELPGITNPHLASDLAIAALGAEAAARAAMWNVRVNLPGLPPDASARFDEESRALLAVARDLAERTARAIEGGTPPVGA